MFSGDELKKLKSLDIPKPFIKKHVKDAITNHLGTIKDEFSEKFKESTVLGGLNFAELAQIGIRALINGGTPNRLP